MSERQSDPAGSKEFRILRAMKQTLTGVIKDTATQPGLKHPLSERTIEDIRQCLMLISARERELAEAAGSPMNMRPHYADGAEARAARQGSRGCGFADEPQKSVVVPIRKIGHPKKPENK
jgi:hypothetical protein